MDRGDAQGAGGRHLEAEVTNFGPIARGRLMVGPVTAPIRAMGPQRPCAFSMDAGSAPHGRRHESIQFEPQDGRTVKVWHDGHQTWR